MTSTTVIVEVRSKSGGRSLGAWLVPIGGRIRVGYYGVLWLALARVGCIRTGKQSDLAHDKFFHGRPRQRLLIS